MEWSWSGRVVVVTGASSGIGRRVAVDASCRGATVVVAARRAELLDEVVEQCRLHAPRSRAVPTDLADQGAPEALVESVLETEGGIDVLVNNAAVSMRVHARNLTAEQVERVMRVNFEAPVRTTLAALPAMLARRSGHVVNVSSVAGRVASPREAAYTASKFALAGWTDAMASDLAGSGVSLHLVHPGPIDTDIWATLAEPASYRGRFYPPERVSAAVLGCVEKGRYERWVPAWMGMLPLVRTVAPGAYVKAAGLFDRRGVRRAGGARESPLRGLEHPQREGGAGRRRLDGDAHVPHEGIGADALAQHLGAPAVPGGGCRPHLPAVGGQRLGVQAEDVGR